MRPFLVVSVVVALGASAGAETALTGNLGRLYAVMESYPNLKANQEMTALMEELTSTENKVAFARQAYNDSVLSYNNRRQAFPGSVIAGLFHFDAAAQWQIDPGHPETRDAPKVQF